MKRAQGLPLETVIIAALLIGLLIIVLFVVARQGSTFGKGVSSCEAQGYTCVSSAGACMAQGGQVMNFDCPKKNDQLQACCQR